jgi:hypothetical protein
VVEAAAAVHHVAHGLVEEVAGDLLAGPLGTGVGDAPSADALDPVEGLRLVGLGGGRVVDVAKSLAAARTAAGHPTQALAIPTTLSGAEMTPGHRIAKGAASDLRVRCAVVVHDPALSASQPEPALAASAANAHRPCGRGAVHGAGEPGRHAGGARGRARDRRRVPAP